MKEALVRLRRQALPYRGQRLSLSLLVLALAWRSPYLYVVIQGRNLPWFVWVLLAALVLVTGWDAPSHRRKPRSGQGKASPPSQPARRKHRQSEELRAM